MSASIVCLFFLLASGLTYAVPNEGVYFGTQNLILTDRNPIPTKCIYNTFQKMLQAMCANLNFNQLPPRLRKDTQILDFSGNRLRDLKNDTLSSFTSLSFIYFTDNFFTDIEDAAFVNLKKLEVLDLSKNALSDIPKNIFALPAIRIIYLSENKLGDNAMDPTPFADESTLQILDVSKNHLTKLPRLGILPYLKRLNVSRNLITNLKTEDIAAFCTLKVLDLSHNPIIFTDHCECQAINAWIVARNITMFPPKFNCTDEKRSDGLRTPWCTRQPVNELVSNETLKIYDNCKNVLKIQEQTVKARSTWILVVSCIAAFLMCLFIILYCIHRHNKKKKSVNIKRDLVINRADDGLLKGNNVTEPAE
ncbi:trophoblast glycoprotein-like [Chelonus insularis]|uniref:trophoblast glycoprotein-like n=1 Tax=Chelonus insularis TaxID=460826 RepID=UPI00158DCC80|nr:trophoblast glycoprotein-like [Chelonus insularis]XP_034950269.1 trophoblast glycoprotein-like [Chelonus insularis]XP_034950270.1 trophoblast glycoprotein-like [Chelonus insularis]